VSIDVCKCSIKFHRFLLDFYRISMFYLSPFLLACRRYSIFAREEAAADPPELLVFRLVLMKVMDLREVSGGEMWAVAYIADNFTSPVVATRYVLKISREFLH
jgi:hypothetical protein